MAQHAILILAGALVLFPGCAAQRTQPEQRARVAAKQEMPLSPGETIRLESTWPIDAGSFQATIDSEGDVLLPLGLKVHVGGLTPAAATVEVRKAYQPKYYIHWEYDVIRVQPQHAVDGSQSSRSAPAQTPVAAGSRR